MKELKEKIEEAIKAEEQNLVLYEGDPVSIENIKGAIAAYKACYEWIEREERRQVKSKWIRVEDKLPVEGNRYLTFVEHITDLGKSNFVWNCSYNEDEKRFSDSSLNDGERVTHWQPLPEPPKT